MQFVGTTTPLGSNAIWQSDIDPPLGGGSGNSRPLLSETADRVTGTVFADQTGTLNIEQSSDGTHWDANTTQAVVASTGASFSVEIVAPYVRLRYVNGASAQGVFRLYARLSSAGVKP